MYWFGENICGKTFAFADERKAHFIQEHEFTSKPTTSPLKSSLKDGKGKKVKFVKSQRLVGKVHRVQTKTPKHQPANDSKDNSNSSFGSDSSRSVEAAPRELIWRNDTCSSKKGRKVFHLRNVSTIHSVRKRIMTSPMQSHHQDRRQPCHQLQHRLDKHHHCHLQPRQRSRHHRHSRAGYNDQQTQRRQDAAGRRSTTGPVKRNRDQDSRTNTSPLLTSIHAEQSFRVSDSPLESRNGIAFAYQMKNSLSYQLRRVSCGSAILKKQYSRHTFMTLIKTKKIFTAITWYTTHHDAEASGHRGHTPWCEWHRSEWAPRDDAGANVTHPLHQYITYLKDGRRRRCVLTDTGDELVYLLQWQPGFQLEEGNWLEDYNYIRPGQSSIRDEAYRN